MRTPRIIGIIAAFALLYGAWLVEPRWITGALGLIILYVILTNVPAATALIAQADNALAAAFTPPALGASGGKKRR